jgi:hypothetical protein
VRFSRHGRPRAATVAANGPPEHREYTDVASDPIPEPGSPVPALSVPDMREDSHGIVAPVGVSASVVLPAVAVIFPPGLTVQVVAVAADAALGLAAGTAVAPRAAAAARTTAPRLVRTGASLRGRCPRRYRPWQ